MAKERSKQNCEIGRRIAARRKQLGLTQEQAAERADISQQFWATIETGVKSMRADTILKISKALNVSTDYILLGTASINDRSRVVGMLEPLSGEEILEVEQILKSVLAFGGYRDDI